MAFNYEKWSAGMLEAYGPDWKQNFKKWGASGGKVSVPKGFSSMDPERLRNISRRGGKLSKRGKNVSKQPA